MRQVLILKMEAKFIVVKKEGNSFNSLIVIKESSTFQEALKILKELQQIDKKSQYIITQKNNLNLK